MQGIPIPLCLRSQHVPDLEGAAAGKLTDFTCSTRFNVKRAFKQSFLLHAALFFLLMVASGYLMVRPAPFPCALSEHCCSTWPRCWS